VPARDQRPHYRAADRARPSQNEDAARRRIIGSIGIHRVRLSDIATRREEDRIGRDRGRENGRRKFSQAKTAKIA